MKYLSPIPLIKLSGTGNSFFIYDQLGSDKIFIDQLLGEVSRAEFAKEVCNSERYSTADGFIVLEPSSQFHFSWDFYNSDGSSAEMCGNASRCVVDYYSKQNNFFELVEFESIAGVIRGCRLDSKLISVEMTTPSALKNIEVDGLCGVWLDSGVPHYVLEVDDIYASELATQATKIKSNTVFQPKSTNVTYYKIISDGVLQSLTYERGVEGYTQACGTGAVATSLAYIKSYNIKLDLVELEVPGGILKVELTNPLKPKLIGPVLWEEEFVYEG